MHYRFAMLCLALVAFGCVNQPVAAGHGSASECGSGAWTRARILALPAADFRLPPGGSADELALALLPCLFDPAPAMRDGAAYTGLATLMRGDQLASDTVRDIGLSLQRALDPAQADPDGFGKPFAALVLAEVARVDRLSSFMAPAERDELIDTVSGYLMSLRDYRGFDATDGWRHGVAHAADVFLQLALNPELTDGQAQRMLTAIAAQVVPAEAHFYRFGESERLARPVLFIARRGQRTDAQWEDWLAPLTQPPEGIDNVYASVDGLAWRHNLNAFLNTLFVNASLSSNDGVRRLLPGTEAALRAVP